MEREKEDEVRVFLAAKQAEYHELSQSDAPSKSALDQLSNDIKLLRNLLATGLSKEAKDCPKCTKRPIGHLKTLIPAKPEKQIEEKRTYEVMCVDCGIRSRGDTIRAATLLWNADEHLKG